MAVPLLCSFTPGIYNRINRSFVFLAGFPYMEFVKDFVCQVPLILAVVSITVMPFICRLRLRTLTVISCVALLITLGATNWDPNFNTVLRMEKATSELDWDKVLKLANKKDPTRIQVMYRNIALYQKGRLTEEMFTYPDGSASLHTTAPIPASYICAAPVLYSCGMINSADRIIMEISSSFSKNIYYYKYQAKNALVNGEFDLAKKYISIVSDNPFQKRWVSRYSGFVDDPESMKKDREFKRILPLLEYSGDDYDSVDALEWMMFRHFSNLEYFNEYIYEWQMAMLLTQKDPNNTLYFMFNRNELVPGATVSTGIAEGCTLFASQLGDPDLMQELVEVLYSKQSVIRKFGQFSKELYSLEDPYTDKNRKRIFNQFGDSYWYYYLYHDIDTF